jgi:geranylgeranyl diphosphate synthase type II
MGAILGGGTKETIEDLGRFGLLLGRAFQMQDDLLELTSTSQTMGKSLGSDMLNEKKTWIWLDLQNHFSQTERQSWDQIKASGSFSEQNRKQVMDWMDHHGTLRRAQDLVSSWITEADAILGSRKLQNTDMLKALSDIILHRTH